MQSILNSSEFECEIKLDANLSVNTISRYDSIPSTRFFYILFYDHG